MGCPGQARTKPRSKIQPSQRRRRHRRTAAAAANKSRAATTRAAPSFVAPSNWRIQRASNGRPVSNNLRVWRPTIAQLLARPLATANPSMAQQVAQSTAMHRPPCERPSREAAATNWPLYAAGAQAIVRTYARGGEGASPCTAAPWSVSSVFFCVVQSEIRELDAIQATIVLKDPSLCSDTTVGKAVTDSDPVSRRRSGRLKLAPETFNTIKQRYKLRTIHSALSRLPCWRLGPGSNRNYKKTGSSRSDEINADGFSLKTDRSKSDQSTAGGGRRRESAAAAAAWEERKRGRPCFRYGPFNPYIPIRSTTIGKSRVAIDPIAMRTSWKSNSDIASITSIGYPRMSASGESSTTMHRLLHASGSHPIPPPDDPNTLCEKPENSSPGKKKNQLLVENQQVENQQVVEKSAGGRKPAAGRKSAGSRKPAAGRKSAVGHSATQRQQRRKSAVGHSATQISSWPISGANSAATQIQQLAIQRRKFSSDANSAVDDLATQRRI
ncbi:pentatricopeptide repeat-containing protein [Dorcoceras hygrometricum]|uniref:Pentatricopeptide repeat-containing protein n=1 Tax=Dorcoceras hygrometricum TaxID=472368 RepID=A0A2Z7DCX1_9LAMI|nr:pentatricopeptide repeat-containing protein [Dorcoceras hygrometricum]